jgi:N-acetylmuramoyl-L-alanine amidase
MKMHHGFFVRTLLLLTAYLSASALLAQQDSLRVEFSSSPQLTAHIKTITREGALYASVNDLATVLGLSVTPRPTESKIDISAKAGKVTLLADNPFVVAAETGKKSLILQLVHEVSSSGELWLVPLDDFLSVALPILHILAEYDRADNVLRVGVVRVPLPQFDISTLTMESKANGMMIRIPVNRRLKHIEHWLRQDGWLYVTIADAKIDVDALNALKPQGFIRKITAIQSPGSAQLTFKLGVPVDSEELSGDPESGEIILTLRTPPAATPLTLPSPPAAVAMHSARTPAPAVSVDPGLASNLEQKRDRWALDVIVIDAGHGGRDGGATGVTGVQEKVITLGVALKLGRLIKKNLPGVNVVYTRENDRFVELDRRGRIANDAGGKLFISIHCNALRRKPSPTRGFEVYLLRPGRTDEAVAIAERENAVIQMEEGYEERYKHLTDENFILVTMAQSSYVKASEVFADILQKEMEDHAGVPNRGVKQAGFYVLVGASMPNVLVETAYLSNRQDEKILKSDAGQEHIAESILRAIKKYKGEYEKLLNEGKELGEQRAN